MPAETLAPPAKPIAQNPSQAIANLVKGNADLVAKETTAAAPAAAPPEPKPEPKVVDPKPAPAPAPTKGEEGSDYVPSRDNPPKNKKNWDKANDVFESKLKAKDEETASIRSELESVKKQIADNAKAAPEDALTKRELEALKKEKDELSAQLFTAARERHPEFKAKYESKIGDKISDIKSMAPGELGDKIARLLNEPDSQWKTDALKEALGEVDELDRPLIRQSWLEIDKLHRQRNAELATSKDEFNKLVSDHEGKTRAQQEQQAKAQRDIADKLFDAGLDTLKKSKVAELAERSDDKEWNSALTDGIGTARKIIHGEAEPQQVVESVILGRVAYPKVVAERDSLRVENAKLAAQIESLTKANPGLTTPNPKAAPGMSPQTALTRGTTPNAAIGNYVRSLRAEQGE